MATKQEIRRTDVIRCEFCGEDYSVTYKRCPFCDDRANYTNDRHPVGRGGKRVATNKRGGGYGGGMQPVQIIGLVLSIILIIAAVYIVFTVLSPLFDRGEPAVSESQPQVSVSQSDASASQPDVSVSQPDASASQSTPDVSTPVVPDPSGSSDVITPIVPPVASGTKGVIFGTSSGLWVRSGPGRNYEAQDTALNGAEVVILEETSDGWYKINYSGDRGVTKTGYVSKDYVKIN